MRYHVIPINDLREHVPSPSCWCKPTPDEEHDVFTHHAMDRREDYESGQQRIRAVYSVEDEQYFARIGVGAALGVYTFQPGEQDALLAFGAHVGSVRQWGRDERAKIGL